MKAMLKKSSAAESFSFSFVNDEGKMLLKSENYKAKDSASKGVERSRKTARKIKDMY